MDRSLRSVEDVAGIDWSEREVSSGRLIHRLILFLHRVVILFCFVGRFVCTDFRAIRLRFWNP